VACSDAAELLEPDPARVAAGHVPVGTGFATKPAMAPAMIGRAIAARVSFGWVAADSVHDVGSIEMALRCAAKGYVLGVNYNDTHPWRGWHRHVSLVMLTFAMMAVIRRHTNVADEQTSARVSRKGWLPSAGPSRRSAA